MNSEVMEDLPMGKLSHCGEGALSPFLLTKPHSYSGGCLL